MTTEERRPPGRPRKFDPEQGVEVARQLFHARGYDAVGVADLTKALGIKPPSFYAAYGSKAGLYERVLDLYAETGAIPLADILRPERPVSEALIGVLEEAARRYSANPRTAGCLVIEGSRCVDPKARAAASVFRDGAKEAIRSFIAPRHPSYADELTDFIATVMAGLSAEARNGTDEARLLATVRLASASITETV